MNVGEIEKRLGMTRANIRFYEKEGLIQPARSENTYRDYSEEDVKALKKIKLLRQLHVSVETILQIQSGALPLAEALRERMGELETESTELEQARAICAAMTADGATYESLAPERYLSQVPKAAEGYFAPPTDELPTVKRPWARLVARYLDLMLYGLIWLAVHTLLMRFPMPGNFWGTLVDTAVGIVLMLLIEPVLLATWGYTPGKWIFGLKVRAADGRKLTWGDAVVRTWVVIARGYGYGIPVYSIYRLYRCDRHLEDGTPLEWEENCSYTAAEPKAMRYVGMVVALAMSFLMVLMISFRGQMPKYRGDLTAAEFYANCNDLNRYMELLPRHEMDGGGNWVELPQTGGTFYFDFWENPRPAYQVTLTDGKVTAVTLDTVCTDPNAFILLNRDNSVHKQLAAAAFIGAQPSFNVFSWTATNPLKRINEEALGNYSFQSGGVTVKQTVEYSGYELIGNTTLEPLEGEQPYIRILFTMEK